MTAAGGTDWLIATPRMTMPAPIIVEDLLHHLLDILLDLATAGADRVVEADARDDGAHRAFGDLADGDFGLGDLEQVESRVADVPANRISEIDDILITGEDQIFGPVVLGEW